MTIEARSQDEDRGRVLVVTGSRAEFGLLAPVMRAIRSHESLELCVVITGSHLLPPDMTAGEVEEEFEVAARIVMQKEGATGRLADAEALGRGVTGITRALRDRQPDWLLVLGDRIEAFAAASAASVAGVAVAHMHGGDRAEGVADEAMRHAITKLAHLHLPATETSAKRIERMGEAVVRIHVVGSPAMDGLDQVEAMSDEAARELGDPEVVILMHPVGDSPEAERERMQRVVKAAGSVRAVCLHPNFDPGREGIVRAIEESGIRTISHLQRVRFLALLKRLGHQRGVMIGNSSAGLIEAAAMKTPVVNIGDRQGERERVRNVVSTAGDSVGEIENAIEEARGLELAGMDHPYGDGRTGERVAGTLASVGADERRALIKKRNTY